MLSAVDLNDPGLIERSHFLHHLLSIKGKSPVVLFHGITLTYGYFEEI